MQTVAGRPESTANTTQQGPGSYPHLPRAPQNLRRTSGSLPPWDSAGSEPVALAAQAACASAAVAMAATCRRNKGTQRTPVEKQIAGLLLREGIHGSLAAQGSEQVVQHALPGSKSQAPSLAKLTRASNTSSPLVTAASRGGGSCNARCCYAGMLLF